MTMGLQSTRLSVSSEFLICISLVGFSENEMSPVQTKVEAL